MIEGASGLGRDRLEKATVLQTVRASIGRYGIHPYTVLRRAIRRTGLQSHHLIEKRFAEILGLKASEIPSIVLSKDAHLVFTNLWRKAIPYGEDTANATKQGIMVAVEKVYNDFPELFDQAREYLRRLDEF